MLLLHSGYTALSGLSKHRTFYYDGLKPVAVLYRPFGAGHGVYITYRWAETRPNVPVWTAIHPGGPIAVLYRSVGAGHGVYITYRWVETPSERAGMDGNSSGRAHRCDISPRWGWA
jgi:hypothetical protein